MFPNPGIESVLRRELDSLPLPSETEWIPSGSARQGWSAAAWIALAAVLAPTAIVVGPMLADRAGTASQTAPSRTPLVLPTVVDGRGVAPLPNAVRHPELGFNLLVPANWRETTRPTAPEPGLLGRITLTAQTADREAALLATYGAAAKLPWDLTIEVWAADQSAIQLARFRAACPPSCTLGTTVIYGVEYVTSRDTVTGRNAFYVARPDRVLVLTYVIGAPAEQPSGVSADVLEWIVRSVGLP